MRRIHLHLPDPAGRQECTVAPGEVVMVGREPDVTAVEGPLAATPRSITIASPQVSSNHVLLWSDEQGLHARDLDSRNGTYVRLTPGVDTSLGPVAEAHLFLADRRAPSRALAPGDLPATGEDPEQFAAALRDVVEAWMREAGLRPSLRVIRALAPEGVVDDATDDGRIVVPLTEGLVLEVADADAARTRGSWDRVTQQLFPYIWEQVARWRTCRAAHLGRPLAFRAAGSQRALREVLDAARAGLALVLRGETGTGKTELASIYAGREARRPGRSGALRGGDRGPPFITVHCAHLEPSLAHSALFGALKGSFTSADRNLVGAVQRADGGVLFLDDVDALPGEVQAKLLRFLDHGCYEPLGHGQREPMVADVRVVAGTNTDLRAAVRERRFREDLYWRLHVGAVVRVPPLRERPEDIEQVLRDSPSVRDFGAEQDPPSGPGAPSPSVCDRLDAEAFDLLVRRHAWRGNFRELKRFCARVRAEGEGGILDGRRCRAILAEASLDGGEAHHGAPDAAGSPPIAGAVDGRADAAFERALREALALWLQAEGGPPQRFDDVSRFCETYLKSAFVAHSLDLADAESRPEAFDRDRRHRLACDLSTLKRKLDDYLALKRQRGGGDDVDRR